MGSLREAKEMTLGEYFLRMRAYILRQLDDQERAHYQAWLVARVFPAVDAENGEYVVQHLDEVFDRQKREAEISVVSRQKRSKNQCIQTSDAS
ncbi:hypothetical protein BWX42_00165 [Dolosigranulum pigrum]|uniref:Uncharacterized protein n=1 Tax=Dolosigranulum pigrum TaxID=29394 RepID=A0A1S8KQY8_9LACT|nr:hypothetical protein BWX42_00165 [Dolosigranulum pigrum]